MRGKRALSVSFTALVLALCLLLGFGGLFLPDGGVRANQVLAAAPELTEGDGTLNLDFFSDFETWFGEHFALRQTLVTANAALLAGVFHSSNTDQVIVGESGWLFYASEADDYLDIPTMTEREAANAAISLSLMQEYAAAQGATMLFFAAPNKSSIYPENMPAQYVPLAQDGSFELLYAALEREAVRYLDLRAVLEAVKAGQTDETAGTRLYHRLDSHWTNLGAAYAADAILAALGLPSDYAGADYAVTQDFSGDLYEMLYPMGTEQDYNQSYDLFTYSTGTADRSDTEAIRYAAENPSQTGSLLMFRDSFGNALTPFLAQSFGQSLFTRAVPYDLGLIAEQEADFVILELAERNLATLAERAAVMPAPVRDVALPEQRVEAALQGALTRSGTYWMITGCYDAQLSDIGARVYAAVTIGDTTTVYEATPAGELGEGSYTLYLPEDAGAADLTLSLILTYGGRQVATETIALRQDA